MLFPLLELVIESLNSLLRSFQSYFQLAGNEALRRYGEMIVGDDDEIASCSSSQLQPPVPVDRYRRSSG